MYLVSMWCCHTPSGGLIIKYYEDNKVPNFDKYVTDTIPKFGDNDYLYVKQIKITGPNDFTPRVLNCNYKLPRNGEW